MNTYYIRKSNEADFEHMTNLAKSGLVDGLQLYEGGKIVDSKSGNAFILKSSTEASSENSARFENDGASWFRVFRSSTAQADDSETDKAQDADAKWREFVEAVISEFYRKYSYLEYHQGESLISDEQRKKDETTIKELFETAYGEFHLYISPVSDDAQIDHRNTICDVYGATVKLSLTDGAGEAKNVLGKLLFKKSGDYFIPVPAEHATQVLKVLQSFSDSEEQAEPSNESFPDKILNNLSYFFNSKITDDVPDWFKTACSDFDENRIDISKYIVYANDKDFENIQEMLDNGPSDEVHIVCGSASLLSIFHARWKTRSYLVMDYRTKPTTSVFLCSFGIDNRLNVSRLLCEDELIDGNYLVGMLDDENHRLSFVQKEDGGIEATDYVAEQLEKVFANHAIFVDCTKDILRGAGCSRLCCTSSCLNIDISTSSGRKSTRLICEDCPYPEMVTRIGSKTYFTRNLNFDAEALELTTSKLMECKVCGGKFTELDSKRMCTMCAALTAASTDNSTNNDGPATDEVLKDSKSYRIMRSNYKKYAYMLSPLLRAFGGYPRLCTEDDKALRFRLGKTIYVVDKTTAGASGYLKPKLPYRQ